MAPVPTLVEASILRLKCEVEFFRCTKLHFAFRAAYRQLLLRNAFFYRRAAKDAKHARVKSLRPLRLCGRFFSVSQQELVSLQVPRRRQGAIGPWV